MAFAALSLASCRKDDGDGPVPVPERVLLVYVGTDNNLSGYEQAKLQGLRDGWTGNADDRIIVYIDKGGGAPARLIEISNLVPGGQPREIAVYGDENSASPVVFGRVISDVAAMFPDAGSCGLLVFSHASGWLPEGVYNSFANGVVPDAALSCFGGAQSRSVAIDGTSEMSLAEFAAAIPDGMFDYIVFEACFMAGIEVAYELRGKAPYILASSAEIIDPGFAPVYHDSTAELFAADLSAFGQSVFGHTLTYAEDNPRRSATYSVINTAALDVLAEFIRENCDLTREVDIADVQHFDRLKDYRLFFDFEDYYGRLLDTDGQRAELSRLMANCIVWKAATETFMTQSAGYNGFTIAKHSGLTVHITQPAFPGLTAAYGGLEWAKALRP